jgi:outer membrane protein OmpA-like peptidoglycan-associated protein
VSEQAPSGAPGSASASPGTPLPSWEERSAKAPARFSASSVPDQSKERLGWRFGQIDAALVAVKELWLGEPDLCDSSQCRDAWRRLGAKLKAAEDALRAMRPGLCGYPLEPASLEQHLGRHATFVSETFAIAKSHWDARAATLGVLAEQEWQKQVANASLVPPMPCLSCVAPDRRSLSSPIEFDEGSATLSSAGRNALEEAVKTPDPKWFFEVWGHAGSSEANPVELARRRAEAVETELVKRGVDKRRILIVSAGADLSRAPRVEVAIITR